MCPEKMCVTTISSAKKRHFAYKIWTWSNFMKYAHVPRKNVCHNHFVCKTRLKAFQSITASNTLLAYNCVNTYKFKLVK